MPTCEYDAREDVVLAHLETLVRGLGGRARIEDRTEPGSELRVLEVVPDSDGAASITVEYLVGDHDELWTTVAGFNEAGDLDWLALLFRAVAAGRVRRLDGDRRSRLEVEVAPGDVRSSTGYAGIRSLGPRPGWRRRATVVEYAPY